MTDRSKIFLLIFLLAVEGLLLSRQWSSGWEERRAPLKYTPVAPRGTGGVRDEARLQSAGAFGRSGDPLSVRLDLLKQKSSPPSGRVKNIFVSLLPPPPPPPPTLPPPPPPPLPPPPPSAEEIALGRAREELTRFRYLGYLDKGGKASAFLSKGDALFITVQGEEIEGRFLLRELSAQFAVVRHQATGAEITLTLSP